MTATGTSGTTPHGTPGTHPAGPTASAPPGPPGGAAIPPHARLLLLTNGKRVSQVVYALAEAGVADVLAGGELTVSQLAEKTGTDPGALRRMLRCAAAVGVFTLREGGKVGLTDMAQALRSDVPNSQRDMILFNGSEAVSRPYAEISTALRTGRPVFDDIFGMDFFGYLRQHPETSALFDRAMSRMSATTTQQLLESFDFGRFRRIADIGGGQGYFLSELLLRNPGTRGTLVDQPQVVENAPAFFEEKGVAERAEVVSGDFFGELPGGHDAYVLKAVLHDWDDAAATSILRGIRRAIGDDTAARLVVLEHVLAPGDTWDQGKFLDIDMLLRFGGAERDLGEWRELLAAGGFALEDEPAAGRWAVLTCRPV
ncbi:MULTISPECIES: methyltransferase [unclassified Streptomyces]|uniref:methyltransferase n=1 Tax=unclassified Streptomyces TaxID=2593676 RepID=UPI0011CCE360|nr:O-methyltransferase [Streptomyces sp.]